VKVLLLNGPNLGTLGRRQPEIYGTTTLAQIVDAVAQRLAELGADLDHLQSNHEGALIDRLEQLDYEAVIINPGSLAHTSYALHDALVGCGKPVVEVHISDIAAREEWRRTSVTAAAARTMISGHGWQGYLEAADLAVDIGKPGP
jgi:3-dehydroquinate dehydratase-2